MGTDVKVLKGDTRRPMYDMGVCVYNRKGESRVVYKREQNIPKLVLRAYLTRLASAVGGSYLCRIFISFTGYIRMH